MGEDDSIQSWSIIVLCYNESGNIKRVIDEIQEVLKIIAPAENEIILVNDGSSDDSLKVIEDMLRFPENKNIKLINHPENLGIGEALHSGYAHGKYENIAALPGDGQFDAAELIPFRIIPKDSIISFYRIENTTYSFSRNVLAWVNRGLNKTFVGFKLKDVNWVKVYKNEALKKLDLEIRSSLIESEICSKLIYVGHRPTEVKSKYLVRQSGVSKGASFNIVKQALLDVIKLIRVFRRFKRRVKKRDIASKKQKA